MKKKGLSEMMGYVLLISIGLILAFLVFGFLKSQIPNAANEKKCNDDTSITVKSVKCIGGNIELNVRNSGKHRIDDLIIKGRTSDVAGRTLANLDLSTPGSGGFVALGENEAQHPGGEQLITLPFYTRSCTDIGSDCDTTNDICVGKIDCNRVNGVSDMAERHGFCDALRINVGVNCEWVPDNPAVPNGNGLCKGIDTCDKLGYGSGDPADNHCAEAAFIGYCCADGTEPPISNSNVCGGNYKTHKDFYKVFQLEIKPERQQPDAQGKNESVICSDAAITIDAPENCYLYTI
ncbi:hypothetical protein COU57_02970 [Candidatus Pacearchaeota archaeon CG10_big_fil_rev_8_21_14_0_10_32_14]|nr:MAG: hypothetical protein COU57_02970 [Candidatus Pacearchaeota archaeon CG10_big_fil_rev_8_21_14_0_10_32_14]